jgi:hypothetical protein
MDVAVAANGTMYIADTFNYRTDARSERHDQHVRRHRPNGLRRRSATSARLTRRLLALDGTGKLYIADRNNYRVRAVDRLRTRSPPLPANGRVSPATAVLQSPPASAFPAASRSIRPAKVVHRR